MVSLKSFISLSIKWNIGTGFWFLLHLKLFSQLFSTMSRCSLVIRIKLKQKPISFWKYMASEETQGSDTCMVPLQISKHLREIRFEFSCTANSMTVFARPVTFLSGVLHFVMHILNLHLNMNLFAIVFAFYHSIIHTLLWPKSLKLLISYVTERCVHNWGSGPWKAAEGIGQPWWKWGWVRMVSGPNNHQGISKWQGEICFQLWEVSLQQVLNLHIRSVYCFCHHGVWREIQKECSLHVF